MVEADSFYAQQMLDRIMKVQSGTYMPGGYLINRNRAGHIVRSL